MSAPDKSELYPQLNLKNLSNGDKKSDSNETIIGKMLQELLELKKQRRKQQLECPEFKHFNNFREYANEIVRNTKHVELNTQELIDLSMKKLDGLTYMAAREYLRTHEQNLDWTTYIEFIEKVTKGKISTNRYNSYYEKQKPDQSFSEYAIARNQAIIELFPTMTIEQRFMMIVTGTRKELYEYLYPKILENKITRLDQLVEESYKYQESGDWKPKTYYNTYRQTLARRNYNAQNYNVQGYNNNNNRRVHFAPEAERLEQEIDNIRRQDGYYRQPPTNASHQSEQILNENHQINIRSLIEGSEDESESDLSECSDISECSDLSDLSENSDGDSASESGSEVSEDSSDNGKSISQRSLNNLAITTVKREVLSKIIEEAMIEIKKRLRENKFSRSELRTEVEILLKKVLEEYNVDVEEPQSLATTCEPRKRKVKILREKHDFLRKVQERVIKIKGIKTKALLDSCSNGSFITNNFVIKHNLERRKLSTDKNLTFYGLNKSNLGTVKEYIKPEYEIILDEGNTLKSSGRFFITDKLTRKKGVEVLVGMNILGGLPIVQNYQNDTITINLKIIKDCLI